MSSIIVKLKKKADKFDKIFTKEEKLVIILGSIVVILGFILGIIAFFKIASAIFNWYIDVTAPYVMKALNNLLQIFLPGWTIV